MTAEFYKGKVLIIDRENNLVELDYIDLKPHLENVRKGNVMCLLHWGGFWKLCWYQGRFMWRRLSSGKMIPARREDK